MHHEKSRKRTRNPQKNKIFRQKVKVQSGIEHVTKSGRTVKGKKFCAQTKCGCKKNCSERICVTRQKKIFDVFYALENFTQKRLYLRSMVKTMPMKENLSSVSTTIKRTTYKYYLTNDSGVEEEVCFKFFLACLQISDGSLYRAIKSLSTNESAVEKRGKFPTRKTSSNAIHFVTQFIKRIPSYQSHYAASKSNKKYLHPNLNITRLYKEYKIICQFEKRKSVSEWKFREIFNTKFNLGFHPVKVDTCRTCDRLEARIQSENINSEKREHATEIKRLHLRCVENTKKNFQNTIDNARNESENTEIFTFDLQRALEVPSISTSEAFYRRQLWCYNLCIYDEKHERAYMYFWHEAIASRGACEISSCLIKHFHNFLPTNTKKIILNSDACPGQNRNIKITLMLKKFLDAWPYSDLKVIEQRYFVSGHSYNNCDRCFGLVEIQKKATELLYEPKHWISLISQAKKSEPKFTVIEMLREDFFSSKTIEREITNRKKTVNNEKIDWMKIQRIINTRSNPFQIQIENYGNYNKQFNVNLRKRGKNNSIAFSDVNLEPLYTQQRKIKYKKYADLQKLMQYIPDKFQSFYATLEYENDQPKAKRVKGAYDSCDEIESL